MAIQPQHPTRTGVLTTIAQQHRRATCCVLFFVCASMGLLLIGNQAVGQTNQEATGQPFIGFQSFDGTRSPIGRTASSGVNSRSAVGVRGNGYAYPASGQQGYQTTGIGRSGQAPVQPRINSQMSRGESATGGINNFGQATSALGTNSSNFVARPQLRQTSYQQPVTRSAQAVQDGWGQRQSNSNRNSSQNGQVQSRQPLPSAASIGQPTTARIPSNRPRMNQPVVQQTSSTLSNNRTSVARIPSSTGRTTTARPAQSCVCVPSTSVPRGYVNPNLAYRQPQAANQAPSLLGGGAAAANYNSQPGYQMQPGLGVPQFANNSGSVLTPFVTGSGVYTPLLPFRAMPPRSYLGQGIIGQPTAYVDGQLFRNLLRYISP